MPRAADEGLRLRYRHLDLRREELQRNLRLRHTAGQGYARLALDAEGFLEVETPVLSAQHPRGGA
jgi:aspartyl-tRNA synthetase